MKKFAAFLFLILLPLTLAGCSQNQKKSNGRISVVSSLNFYGECAQQILGNHGHVYSLINSDTDPHDYEPTANDAKLVSSSQVVIENGLGYDDWMNQLIKNSGNPKQKVINVGILMKKHDGDNEHIWYDPETMDRFCDRLVSVFSSIQPKSHKQFLKNSQKYKRQWQTTKNLIDELKKHSNGRKVAVSEPVFDYSLESLGYRISDNGFANAIDKGIDPSVHDISALQSDLRNHKVAFFVNNTQAESPVVSQMRDYAEKHHVKILNVSETAPKGKTYIQWMTEQYRQLKKLQ